MVEWEMALLASTSWFSSFCLYAGIQSSFALVGCSSMLSENL